MPQTFEQAKKILARYASAYDLADIGLAINTAIDELASSSNWQKMKRVKRFYAYNAIFPLPQDCESLVRACIDGRPISIRGMDYEFLYSGPGDLDYVPAGYAPLHGIKDMGYFPTMYPIGDAGAVRICAFGADTLSDEAIKVVGIDENGDVKSEEVYFSTWSEATGIDGVTYATIEAAVAAKTQFVEITQLVLPPGLSSYVSLYFLKEGEFYFLSRMHPSIRIPEFRRYAIPGFSDDADVYYNVLAEVKLKGLPLVADHDVLPFDSLLPVQYMLQSMCFMNSGEVKAADDYRQRAILSISVRENTQQERQGMVILNTQYDGSLGQASAESWVNI